MKPSRNGLIKVVAGIAKPWYTSFTRETRVRVCSKAQRVSRLRLALCSTLDPVETILLTGDTDKGGARRPLSTSHPMSQDEDSMAGNTVFVEDWCSILTQHNYITPVSNSTSGGTFFTVGSILNGYSHSFSTSAQSFSGQRKKTRNSIAGLIRTSSSSQGAQ